MNQPPKLPFPQNLRVDESKVVDYLLSHSNGQGKAAFFLGFGFRSDAWVDLAEALKAHAHNNPVAAEVSLAVFSGHQRHHQAAIFCCAPQAA